MLMPNSYFCHHLGTQWISISVVSKNDFQLVPFNFSTHPDQVERFLGPLFEIKTFHFKVIFTSFIVAFGKVIRELRNIENILKLECSCHLGT